MTEKRNIRFLKRLTSLALVAVLCAACLLPAAAAPRGDADGDGLLTPGDARLALRVSVGLDRLSDPTAADVDGDGKVTSSDARLILRAAVGLEILDDGNGTAAAEGIAAWLRRNGDRVSTGSYIFREEEDGMSITLMSDPSRPAYPVSVGMTMKEGRHYSYQSIVLFNATFTECVMQMVMYDGSVEVMRNLYKVDHTSFSYATRASSLTLLETKGVSYYKNYVAEAVPTMAYYSLRWLVLVLQDYDMGADPARDLHLNGLV